MNQQNPKETKSLDELVVDLRQHDWAVNSRTADALAEMGEAAIPCLLQALESKDGYARNGAAIALGKIRNPEATSALIAALRWRDNSVSEEDEDQGARISAATALGKVGNSAASAALLAELKKVGRTELALASYIVAALGEIGDSDAIPLLSRMFEHWDFETQKMATWALARMGPKGTQALLCIAADRTRLGRLFAINALQTNGAESAVPVLTDILKNESDDKFVRAAAARALGRIGKSPAVLPLLLAMLGASENEIKSSAAMGLGYLRDPAAYEAIVSHLENPELRYVAAMALGELRDARACKPLILALEEDDLSLAIHAATALAKLGCPDAIPALIGLRDRQSESPVWQAHRAAVDAAIEMLQRQTMLPPA
jgi:HEAT repeat protein